MCRGESSTARAMPVASLDFAPDVADVAARASRCAGDAQVKVTANDLWIGGLSANWGLQGTVGDTDPIVQGCFERKARFLVPDEDPPILELTLDKDSSEVYQTFSYGTLLWPRLFNDDIPLGEGLFEADLTDLPPELLEKFQTAQARSDEQSRKERQKRQMMTEEEVAEETARLWNDEFARHGIPHRVDSLEDRRIDSYQQ
ncbi:unnamed protein product [Effrenium voratum]|nr:unnamed protein product [Effrenium voratum]